MKCMENRSRQRPVSPAADDTRTAGKVASRAERGAGKYVTPKLVEYGSTAKLNASKPGSFTDGSNTLHMTCL